MVGEHLRSTIFFVKGWVELDQSASHPGHLPAADGSCSQGEKRCSRFYHRQVPQPTCYWHSWHLGNLTNPTTTCSPLNSNLSQSSGRKMAAQVQLELVGVNMQGVPAHLAVRHKIRWFFSNLNFTFKTPLAGLAVGSLWPTKADTVAQ